MPSKKHSALYAQTLKPWLLLLMPVLLYSCENSESDIELLRKKAVQKDEAVKVESYLSQGGKVKAKLTSPLMLRIMADTPYVEFPKTLHVDFYNEAKAIDSKMDSKYGKYFETLGKVYLRDSVKVVSAKRDTLYCHDLWWDQDKELFYTDKPATLRTPTALPIYGKHGLEATQDFKRVTFKQVENSRLLSEGDGLPGKATSTNSAADTARAPR